jgi:hypothetical protein
MECRYSSNHSWPWHYVEVSGFMPRKLYPKERAPVTRVSPSTSLGAFIPTRNRTTIPRLASPGLGNLLTTQPRIKIPSTKFNRNKPCGFGVVTRAAITISSNTICSPKAKIWLYYIPKQVKYREKFSISTLVRIKLVLLRGRWKRFWEEAKWL